jgi:hypothetical protein
MPAKDPDSTDPLGLNAVGVPDETGEGTRQMAECFAEEFLRLGHGPEQVIELFRSPRHRLAHHAWTVLGAQSVTEIVTQAAAIWSPAHRPPAPPSPTPPPAQPLGDRHVRGL